MVSSEPTTKNKKRDIPRCPPQEALPPSRILWEGHTKVEPVRRCRVVSHHVWTLFKDADDWVAEPAYTFEIAHTKDAMGVQSYIGASRGEIPNAFFDFVETCIRNAPPPIE
jgi:hypothetical protein